MIKEGFVDVPGGKIWYQLYKQNKSQDLTPLIILHGGPGTPHNYLLNLANLSEQRPILFYDQLGCGKSFIENAPKHLWVLSRFVEELEALTNSLGIAQFHLFGHSWGGTLALEYAFTYPKKVRSLILASPVLSVPLWIEDTKKLLKQLPAPVQQIIIEHEEAGTTQSAEYQEAKKLFNELLCLHSEPSPEVEYSLSHGNKEIYHTMWGPSEFSVSGNLKNFDRINDLSKLTMPILLTCGRFDEASPQTMQVAQKNCKEAQLVIFEKSAHIPHVEEPEKYLATLVKFLTNLN